MLFLTTSAAPPEAAPEMILMSFPLDVCQALIAGFGPTYAASSWPASSAVASSVPVLNGTSLRVTPLPRSLVKMPSFTPTSAVACVMLVRNPSVRVTGAAAAGLLELPDPDELAAEEPHPAAIRATAATPAATIARFIVHLFRSS